MRDDHDDELVGQTFQERAEAVLHLFRRRPHNLIEKIEKLGFTYRVDDSEALQAHYADCAVKKSVIDGLLVENEKHEDTVAF